MKVMDLDNIRDTLEEGFDYEIERKERYELVALLQEIIDMHTYEEREANVEVKVNIAR